MYNDEFNNYYEKNVLPLHGNIRNENIDALLLDNNKGENIYSIIDTERVDYTNIDTYSIDPDGCEDADDAFSIYEETGKLFLAIHIADPTHFITLESILWKDILGRVVTKYPLGCPPIHMMPHEIMEKCSLMENSYGKIKHAITICTEISKSTFLPVGNIKLQFSVLCVKKENAFTYSVASMMGDDYPPIYYGLKISNALKNRRKEETLGVKLSELNQSTIKFENGIPYLYRDTLEEMKMKQMIAEFAIFANTFIGEYLKINMNGCGIFRTCNAKDWLSSVSNNVTGEHLLNEIIINGIQADYLSEKSSHDLVGSPEYCHFTSPIRRLADCVCHYLLKYLYLQTKNKNINCPFTNEKLDNLSMKCLAATKSAKKIQYQDIKIRLFQCMHNLIDVNKHVDITYFITSYTGMFLNIIICKIDMHNVHLSYTLRVKNCNHVSINKKQQITVTKINIPDKYDQGTIPELDHDVLDVSPSF